MENEKPVKVKDKINKGINKFYTVCGVVICLCAIVEFIVWIVDSSKVHLNNQLIMGAGFLSLTVGVLWYILVRSKNRTIAAAGLWLTILACIVLFFIGLWTTPSVSEAATVLGAVPAPL